MEILEMLFCFVCRLVGELLCSFLVDKIYAIGGSYALDYLVLLVTLGATLGWVSLFAWPVWMLHGVLLQKSAMVFFPACGGAWGYALSGRDSAASPAWRILQGTALIAAFCVARYLGLRG